MSNMSTHLFSSDFGVVDDFFLKSKLLFSKIFSSEFFMLLTGLINSQEGFLAISSSNYCEFSPGGMILKFIARYGELEVLFLITTECSSNFFLIVWFWFQKIIVVFFIIQVFTSCVWKRGSTFLFFLARNLFKTL